MHVIGDIEGRNCVIMDDMIDTAGTLVKAAEVLKERGAKKVYAYCTHAGVFRARPSSGIVQGLDALDEVVITNTIPLSERQCPRRAARSANSRWRRCLLKPYSASPSGESVMSLFSEQDNLF